jgi:hypothetical protein
MIMYMYMCGAQDLNSRSLTSYIAYLPSHICNKSDLHKYVLLLSYPMKNHYDTYLIRFMTFLHDTHDSKHV